MPFEKLIAGYKSFHKDFFEKDRLLYEELGRGQSPETLIIACSDSRVDPAMITNSLPGELFVVRNVAAIVPPYKIDDQHHGTSAAIEFAVKSLKVKHIIVLGHSFCGGVHALSEIEKTAENFEFISQWMKIGSPALHAVEAELKNASPGIKQTALEQAVVLVSMNNLMTFPWIAAAVGKGELDIHGWYFQIKTGQLKHYDTATGLFTDIEKSTAMKIG